MERRKAIKKIGLGLGYAVGTPTLLSVIQRCKQERTYAWTPDFLSPEEGRITGVLADLILPKTDTPSASEVNVPIFVDQFAHQVFDARQQRLFQTGLARFTDKAMADSGRPLEDLGAAELEPVLSKTLRTTPRETEEYLEVAAGYLNGEGAEPEERISRFAFAHSLRELVILGYKNCETIGEGALAYLPIPGEYIPCAPLQELTQGKAWSL